VELLSNSATDAPLLLTAPLTQSNAQNVPQQKNRRSFAKFKVLVLSQIQSVGQNYKIPKQ
jgi:hypothetical protein